MLGGDAITDVAPRDGAGNASRPPDRTDAVRGRTRGRPRFESGGVRQGESKSKGESERAKGETAKKGAKERKAATLVTVNAAVREIRSM